MARAIAEAMAPPMLEFAICCISMISGKTRDSPASASALIRPTKCASTVTVTAMSTTLTTTFGAARRNSVETIGPSRRRRVRAAGGLVTDIAVAAIEALPFVMALLPLQGLEQRLDGASWESRAAALEPDAGEVFNSPAHGKASFLGLARKYLMPSPGSSLEPVAGTRTRA